MTSYANRLRLTGAKRPSQQAALTGKVASGSEEFFPSEVHC